MTLWILDRNGRGRRITGAIRVASRTYEIEDPLCPGERFKFRLKTTETAFEDDRLGFLAARRKLFVAQLEMVRRVITEIDEAIQEARRG